MAFIHTTVAGSVGGKPDIYLSAFSFSFFKLVINAFYFISFTSGEVWYFWTTIPVFHYINILGNVRKRKKNEKMTVLSIFLAHFLAHKIGTFPGVEIEI